MRRLSTTILICAALAALTTLPALAQKGDPGPSSPGVPTRTTGGPDAFGYTFFDQVEEECNTNFVDISATGTAVTYTASAGFPAEDDGGAVITLGAPFNFYGTEVTSMVVSSNGYLGMGAGDLTTDESGGDFSNDCPLPLAPDNPPAISSRIMPYHDDLAGDGTGGTTFFEFFASCPRAGESGGDEACTIVQWTNWGFFNGTVGFDMQAILYHTSWEIAYEYSDPGAVADGTGATVGIQNASATDSLMYFCDTPGSIIGTGTLCTFHPDFPPGSLAGGPGGLPIPTMNPVGLAALVLMLALGGVMFMARRRTA